VRPGIRVPCGHRAPSAGSHLSLATCFLIFQLNLTSTVFSRFCGVAREKFFAFIKVFAMIENSDE
jgi:hypothetical protein